jgi:phosphopantothenoylcysteine decarboxylase/phosphopantothenate--cysteine ligase
MQPLRSPRIVLGVTGGIAAYKAVAVCRGLVEAGAHVSPVLTSGALHFVGKTTFDALGSEPAQMSLWNEASPIPHTRLGQGADLIVVAPATARLLSDYRTGRSADLLTATLIATRAPVLVCPAMHTEMWEHPAVADNVAVLAARGVHVLAPEEGRLAGGDSGSGRLADPERIVAAAMEILSRARSATGAPTPHGLDGPHRDLAGLRVVVSAGGTREPIDPVRFIGNRSSGKQGHAVAEAAARRGANTTLVTTSAIESSGSIERVQVESAEQMRQAMRSAAAAADVVVMAAAVADFRPVAQADRKLKKRDGVPEIVLEQTADILAELGAAKPAGQVLVGFAAETDALLDNAREKLQRKHADLLVANDVGEEGAGFEHATNHVFIISATESIEVPMADKSVVAERILDAVARRLGR